MSKPDLDNYQETWLLRLLVFIMWKLKGHSESLKLPQHMVHAILNLYQWHRESVHTIWEWRTPTTESIHFPIHTCTHMYIQSICRGIPHMSSKGVSV